MARSRRLVIGVESGEVGVEAFFCTWRMVCVAFYRHSYLSRLHHQQPCSVGAASGRTENVGQPPSRQYLCVRFLFLSQSHRAVRLNLLSRPRANKSVHVRHQPWRPAPQAQPQRSSRRERKSHPSQPTAAPAHPWLHAQLPLRLRRRHASSPRLEL